MYMIFNTPSNLTVFKRCFRGSFHWCYRGCCKCVQRVFNLVACLKAIFKLSKERFNSKGNLEINLQCSGMKSLSVGAYQIF